jgi:hypothetical protein
MHPRLIRALLVTVVAAAGASIGIAAVFAVLGVSPLDLGSPWHPWRLVGVVVSGAVGGYLSVLLAFWLVLSWFVRKVGNREFRELAASMPQKRRNLWFFIVPFRRILQLHTTGVG